MDTKDANRPVRPERETFALGHLGRKDARDVDSRKSREPIRLHHVSSADKGQGSPFRADRRFLSQTALEHLGQKDAKGTKEPAGPRTNQIMTRVTREKVKKSK
ncbi:hypothetical protein KI387_019214, partial [Taxus chinensis]